MIELISDLGGGKTTFVQGLVAGLGYAGPVTSPTFTLSNVYQLEDGRQIHHYDLYRLSSGGVVADELSEDVGAPDIITVIEWAGAAKDELPADRLRVTLEVTGESDRRLSFAAAGPKSESIIKGLSA